MLWGVKKISHFMRDFLLYPICGCYILFAVAMWDSDELIGGGEEEFEGF